MNLKLRSFVLWLLPAAVVAVAVARVSVWVQPHFAPLVVFPAAVGAALGALICGLLQIAKLSDWRLALPGTIFVALLTAAAEHGFFYLDRDRQQLRKALEAGIPEQVLTRATFMEYLRGQAELNPSTVTLWIVNAVVLVCAACGMVIWYLKTRGDADRGHAEIGPDPNPLATGEAADAP